MDLKQVSPGLNSLNKKPINTIIKDDMADKTCALSKAGDIISIEKKFPSWKKKSIDPIIINVLPLNFMQTFQNNYKTYFSNYIGFIY